MLEPTTTKTPNFGIVNPAPARIVSSGFELPTTPSSSVGNIPRSPILLPLLHVLPHPPFQTLSPQSPNPSRSPSPSHTLLSSTNSSPTLVAPPPAGRRLFDHLSSSLPQTEADASLSTLVQKAIVKAKGAVKETTKKAKKTIHRLWTKAKDASQRNRPTPIPIRPSRPLPPRLPDELPGRRPGRIYPRPLTLHENRHIPRRPVPLDLLLSQSR